MVDFGGWDLPVEYTGITAEHMAVRECAGMFDVSHMGEIEIAGRDALDAVQRVSCNDASKIAVGQAQYSGLMSDRGTFVDDLLVYRLAPQHFLLVVNASHIAEDYAHITANITSVGDAVAVDTSSRYGLIAVQGPRAVDTVQPLTAIELSAIKRYRFEHGEVAGVLSTISRTGYTGEDGFEIFLPPGATDRVWVALLESGQPFGLLPCGIGARDTLRLEAAMRLHGRDIDKTSTPIEAGLSAIVGWHKDDFLGLDALRRQRAEGVTRRLVGFEVTDPGIAREGYHAYVGDQRVGVVTSGTRTPYLKRAIGMAYLSIQYAETGQAFDVDIRGRRAEARVVPMPFYKRSRPVSET